LLKSKSHSAGKLIAEIGKAEQAYGPIAPGFQKLWAISKKYGPWQLWDGPEVKEKKYWYFSKGCNFW